MLIRKLRSHTSWPTNTTAVTQQMTDTSVLWHRTT
jgi:hypothetical protein